MNPGEGIVSSFLTGFLIKPCMKILTQIGADAHKNWHLERPVLHRRKALTGDLHNISVSSR